MQRWLRFTGVILAFCIAHNVAAQNSEKLPWVVEASGGDVTTTQERGLPSKIGFGAMDGLEFTVEIGNQIFYANDILTTQAKFKNLSDHTIYISKRQVASNELFFTYGFTSKGGGIVPGPERPKYSKPALSEEDFVPIPAGESYEIRKTIQLSDYRMWPGEYNLIIYYHSLWWQDDCPQIQGLWGTEHGTLYADVMVGGNLLSRPASIRIIE